MKIVIVDDEPANIALLERILEWGQFKQNQSFTNPLQALQSILSVPPDLVLLDLHMPRLDGYAILSKLRSEPFVQFQIPVVVLTADAATEAKLKALGLGASDFVTKPVDAAELILRIRNVLEIRFLYSQLRQKNEELVDLVASKTGELVAARLDALERLALTAEFRDDDTGDHAKRVGRLSAEIAQSLNSTDAEPELMEMAAPLHDIGKVAIPDSILLKPGKLTEEEFEVMKTHTTIGAKILGGSKIEIFSLGSRIAISHHEKWNGSGYPLALRGEDIPLSGRIVAVADVFDALTNRRAYKEPWPAHKAMQYIVERAGSDFDPSVVKVFRNLYWVEGLAAA